MPSKIKMKSCFFALIVFDVAIVRNFVQAAGSHSFDVASPKDFNDKVLKGKGPIIAQFHAPWCTPCEELTPNLNKAIDAHGGKVKMARVDVSSNALRNVAREQGVRSIPFISAYKNGKCVDRIVGLQEEKQVQEFVKKHVN